MTVPALTLSRTIQAPAEALFRAWLDPTALAGFMCPAPGVTVSEVEVEPRPGGAFLIQMQAGEKRLPHRGEYRVIEPHRRLAFTWCSATAGEGSLVELTFEAIEPAQTRLTLVHTDLPNASARAAHEGGWAHILLTLSQAQA